MKYIGTYFVLVTVQMFVTGVNNRVKHFVALELYEFI